jgi:hypothetical protein
MRPRLIVLAIIVLVGVPRLFARDPFSLSGTVTNTTNPAKPISASATISFDAEGKCVFRIASPLYGSGSCWIDAVDESHHTLSVRSDGPTADITCNGTFDGAGYRGTYIVEYPNFAELSQTGNFSLTYQLTRWRIRHCLSWSKPLRWSFSNIIGTPNLRASLQTELPARPTARDCSSDTR